MRGACPRDLDQSIRSRAGACLSGSAAADVERLKRVRIGCGPDRARPIQIAPSPDRPAPIRVATDPDPLPPDLDRNPIRIGPECSGAAPLRITSAPYPERPTDPDRPDSHQIGGHILQHGVEFRPFSFCGPIGDDGR